MADIIELRDISAGYNGDMVLSGVDLTISELDFIGVIGPNGGGKTTLVKLILGLIKPMQGQVIFHMPGERNLIGYLPQVNQTDKNFPITVLEVVLSGLMSVKQGFKAYSKSEDRKSVV